MLRLLTLLLAFNGCLFTFAQDFEIASVMHYNLLNYRNTTSFCDGANNSALDKEDYLKTILAYEQPDIFTANEIGANLVNASRILDRCLNVDGESKYAQADYSVSSVSSLTNMLFYNTELFTLKHQESVSKALDGAPLVRLIDVYYLYWNDPMLAQSFDTTEIVVFVGHLKAGSSSSDKADRAEATEAVMAYIEDNSLTTNVLFAGDFNEKTANISSIENLTDYSNSTYNFYDPLNDLGSWYNNSSYAYLHTQSTRVSNSNGGCFSTGGSDDRFDIIFMNKAVKDDIDQVEYINNSYRAIGQDGNRFNGNLINPANNSAPQDVIQALYEMSDHLPVRMDLKLTYTVASSVGELANTNQLLLPNPMTSSTVDLKNYSKHKISSVAIYSITGQEVMRESSLNTQNVQLNVGHLPNALYLVNVTLDNDQTITLKTIKSSAH